MTRARLGVLCGCVLLGAGTAEAQTATQGWQFSVDALNVLTRGNDVHVGDVFDESQTDGGTATNSTFDYGVTYQPIVTSMPDKFSVLIAGGYRGPRWGFGGRGWGVSTDRAVEGSEASPAPTSLSSTVTGIRMWDHSDIPVPNDFHVSGYSPVTYHAENGLDTLRIEGFAERLWLTRDATHVAFRFGGAYARLENTRAEGMGQNAALVTVFGNSTNTLTNVITLEATGESTMSLFGPSFGIAGDSTFKRLRIDWLVNPALLIGTAETSGNWVDTDNITEVTVSPGSRVQTTERWVGTIPFSRDERAVIPAVDLQLKASVRVAGPLHVGGGLFSSTWFGVPVAPALSIPGEWTDVDGTGWRAQTRDLTFLGYSVFVAVGF